MESFDETKKKYLKDILDKKKVTLEQRFELIELFSKITDEEHLKRFHRSLLESLENKSEAFTSEFISELNKQFNKTLKIEE